MSRMAERRQKVQTSPKKLHLLREEQKLNTHRYTISIDNLPKVPENDFKAISTISYHPFTQRADNTNYHSIAVLKFQKQIEIGILSEKSPS